MLKSLLKVFNIDQRNQWINSYIFPLILLCTFIVFSPSFLNLSFFWDDEQFIFSNPDLLFAPSWLSFWDHPMGTFKSWPLGYTLFWFLVKYSPFENIIFYKSLNIFFHSINTYLLFRLLTKYKFSYPLLLSFFFMVHPLHVETVSWVFQLLTILSFTFFLNCLLFLINYLEGKGTCNIILSFVFFIFSLATKSIAILMPFFFIAIVWRYNKLKLTNLFLIPFFVISLSFGVFAFKGVAFLFNVKTVNKEKIISDQVISHASAVHRAATAKNIDRSYIDFLYRLNDESTSKPTVLLDTKKIFTQTGWHYLVKIFLPINLKFIYSYVPLDLEIVLFIWGLIILIPILLHMKFQMKTPIIGVVFALSCLLPYSGIIFLPFFSWSFVADRYAYFVTAMIPFIVGGFVNKWNNFYIKAIFALYFVIFLYLNFNNGLKFNNTERLYSEILQTSPHPKIYRTLVEKYLESNNIKEAENILGEGLKKFPQSTLLYDIEKKLIIHKFNLKQ